MRELVPAAHHLIQMTGSHEAASDWIRRLLASPAPDPCRNLSISGDRLLTWRDTLHRAQLVSVDTVDLARFAQLLVVVDVLSAVPTSPTRGHDIRPLVFTVPVEAADLLQPVQRLEWLVNDVAAQAVTELHIGGPFFNRPGWQRLREVVLPALAQRNVAVTFWLHPHESGPADVVAQMLTEAAAAGRTTVRWWQATSPSLMHAKFVLADTRRGYFGSANLTSLGFGVHLEVGVELTPEQTCQLGHLLACLEAAGLFAATRPSGGQ